MAKESPKIIVHAKGTQNATLSPPREKCGSSVVRKDAISKFNPMAKGMSPKIAVVAVSKTGRKRSFPDCTMISLPVVHLA